jgi:hypothetical protein
MQSKATTVTEYLAELPEDRRAALKKVRAVIRKHLPKGYQEGMQYGMISYAIPLKKFPKTYNGQPLALASLASQKQYMSVYLMGVYGEEEQWFREAWAKTGRKLDMGRCCVRFKKLEDLPLELIGEVVARLTPDEFIARYEEARKSAKRRK